MTTKSYSIASARAKLAEILDDVEAGDDIELMRRGKKVAVLISSARYARLAGKKNAFGQAFDAFTKTHDLAEHGVERTFAKGLRDHSTGRQVKL